MGERLDLPTGMLAVVLAVVLGGVVLLGVSLQAPVFLERAPFSPEQFVGHWWVFPASVVFAMVAMAAGVSGALFFSPFFMLVVGRSPAQAIGAGLLTEVFGMGNGLRSYVQQGAVDYATARWLLMGSIPAIVLGSLAAHWVALNHLLAAKELQKSRLL